MNRRRCQWGRCFFHHDSQKKRPKKQKHTNKNKYHWKENMHLYVYTYYPNLQTKSSWIGFFKRFCLHSVTPPIFWSPDGPVENPPKKRKRSNYRRSGSRCIWWLPCCRITACTLKICHDMPFLVEGDTEKDQPMDNCWFGWFGFRKDPRKWKGLLLMGTPRSNDTKTNENMKRPRHEEMKTFIDYNISERNSRDHLKNSGKSIGPRYPLVNYHGPG